MRFTFYCICCIFYCTTAFAQTESGSQKLPADSGYFSSFDGTKIYYESRGKGKTILLVHGFIVNSSSWKKTMLYTDLLNKGYRVVLSDLRGNGHSDKPHDSTAYDNDAEAKDIMLLMDKLRIKSYAAIGYSRGSIITARLLVLDKRVKAAVLGGMGIEFTNPAWPRRLMFYHALRGEEVPELKGAMDYVEQQKLDRLALAWMQRSQPSTSQDVLSKVQQPVLVVWGKEDQYSSTAPELAKLFPHFTTATVPGEHGDASQSADFSIAVQSFFKQHF
ncbi:MAG: alpha/beta hydrolase [Agriterribacter sp.]